MNMTLKALTLVAGVGLASPALAADLRLSAKINSYSGNRAYAVAYIVDSRGKYVSTIHVAGPKSKYYKHFTRWARLMARSGKGVDGTTGASVGSGSTFSTRIKVPNSMLNAGYKLIIETAVENQFYVADDVIIPLDKAHNGKANAGSRYIKSATISF